MDIQYKNEKEKKDQKTRQVDRSRALFASMTKNKPSDKVREEFRRKPYADVGYRKVE